MNILVIPILYLTAFASYLGSWLPLLGGMPAGGVIRDGFIVIFFLITIFIIAKHNFITKYEFMLYSLWLTFIIWVGILLVMDKEFKVALMGAKYLCLYPLVGLFSLSFVLRTKVNINTFRKNIFIIGYIMAVIGILDVISQGGILELLGYRPEYAGDNTSLVTGHLGFSRASGGFTDALNYGYTMSLIALYALYCSFKTEYNTLLLFVMCSLASILSLTRGAIIVLLIGIVMISIHSVSFKKIKKFIYIMPMVIGLIFLFDNIILATNYGELIFGRFMQNDEISETSSNIRITMMQNTINTLINYPFGVGLGRQGAGTLLLSTETRINTDNYLAWIALDSGLFGIVIFMAIIVLNFLVYFHYRKRSGHKFLSIVYLIFLLIAGAVSSAPINPIFSVMYWSILHIEGSNRCVAIK